MKNYYLVRTATREWHTTNSLQEAETIFDKLVADGYSYVELSEVADNGNWYSKSVKIYSK